MKALRANPDEPPWRSSVADGRDCPLGGYRHGEHHTCETSGSMCGYFHGPWRGGRYVLCDHEDYRGESVMSTRIIKMDNNGEIVVVTDALDEESFIGDFSRLFVELALAEPLDFDHNAAGAMGCMLDIVAKMRGYKSETRERRTLLSGSAWPEPLDAVRFEVPSGTPRFDAVAEAEHRSAAGGSDAPESGESSGTAIQGGSDA